MRVNVANLAPIMSHDNLQVDLTVLPEFEVPPQTLDKVNQIISDIPNNVKKKFWSKLSNTELFTAPLSRVLLNETSSDSATDPYYLASRDIRAGIHLPPSVSTSQDKPTTILQRILPPPDFLPSTTRDNPSTLASNTDSLVPESPETKTSAPNTLPANSVDPGVLGPDDIPSIADPTVNGSIESNSQMPSLVPLEPADEVMENLPLVSTDNLNPTLEDAITNTTPVRQSSRTRKAPIRFEP